jgi:hypothetical protein
MTPAQIVQADKERLATQDDVAKIENQHEIQLKNSILLATKSDLDDIDASTVCYALTCKAVLFSIHDIASTLPPAITNIL